MKRNRCAADTPGAAGNQPFWDAVVGAGAVLYDWDLTAGRITWRDSVTAEQTAAAPCSLTPQEFTSSIVAGDSERRAEGLSGVGDHRYDVDFRVQSGAGPCWVNERGRVEVGADGRPRRLVGAVSVIDGRKRREVQFETIIDRDELTGLASGRRLQQALDGVAPRAGAGYLLFSVDHSARIREAFGHQAAQAVVREIGRRIVNRVRGSDLVGRVDKYQFGILVTQSSEAQLAALAGRLLEAVRGLPIDTPCGRIPVTASSGGILLDQAADAVAIMAGAEEALIEAKRTGRDRYSFYVLDRARQQEREGDQAIARAVLSALDADRLCLAYQPIIDAASGRAVQYEALMRMRDEQGALVPAADFMPAVEKLGLARLIDHRALTLAVTELALHPGLCLAVNVSAPTAADPVWFDTFTDLVAGRPDIGRRLTIEITETAAFYKFGATKQFVAMLRAHGCSVALDDFGVGHTSFRHLRELEINVVKIDRSFVRDLAQRNDNRQVVRAMTDMMHGLGLTVVAEGVETAEDARIVAELGVRLLQGYHFARPSLDRPWKQPLPPLRLISSSPAAPGRRPAVS